MLKALLPLFLSAAAALPGLGLRLFHPDLPAPETALLTGLAILGASFILLWACDVAQMDIPQTLALAVVALIAVLPEYAVDMYFTWQAGQHPESDYAHYAIANMTGANRLLIGVAWAAIAGIAWLKFRKAVTLTPERRTEVAFLGLATAYAFVIPIKGSLDWYDGIVLVGLYVWYIRIVSARPCVDCELDGPAAVIGAMRPGPRRLTTLAMFLFAAGVILADAELFSESLVATGKVFGVDEFLLVQWLAPIASEAPEFAVAIMFALRGNAGLALGSLLSAKLNQWTLLVGMIPGVYAASSGSFAQPIPMDAFQLHEILLTAAQSLLAVLLLVNLRLSVRGASLLFVLFAGQLLAPMILGALPESVPVPHDLAVNVAFSVAYLALTAALWFARPVAFAPLVRSMRREG
jgi:cation:H+ antiporter